MNVMRRRDSGSRLLLLLATVISNRPCVRKAYTSYGPLHQGNKPTTLIALPQLSTSIVALATSTRIVIVLPPYLVSNIVTANMRSWVQMHTSTTPWLHYYMDYHYLL